MDELDKIQCDTCGSSDLKRPRPENRKILEDMLSEGVIYIE